jgi:nucleotide-binding universal stress UspA family protein
MHSGPVIIGFDGTPASESALRAAAALLGPRQALLVTVCEAGRVFEVATLPAKILEGPAASGLEQRTAFEAQEAEFEAAQRMADHGADVARQAGLEADGLAVADDITVGETLSRLARENDGQAVVIGAHRHHRLERGPGSTVTDLLRHAPCPVLVAGSPDAEGD